jgi:hypothetical protein
VKLKTLDKSTIDIATNEFYYGLGLQNCERIAAEASATTSSESNMGV